MRNTVLVLFYLAISNLLFSQGAQMYSVAFGIHTSNSFLTEDHEEEFNHRMGFLIQFQYHFPSENRFHYSIGVAYTRIGYSRSFLWEDSTPEREILYGKFPITYEMWDDVHYISFPLSLNYDLGSNWSLGPSVSLDYPIGTGYYRNRSSADLAIVELNKTSFDQTKAYFWNTSLGLETHIGKVFPVNEKMNIEAGAQFKIYGLIAARGNDYFPHEEFERPYRIGFTIGLQFL